MRARSPVPIILLTAKDAEVDKVVGLEVGADDYVTKPFSVRELIGRVRAQLRRRELDLHSSVQDKTIDAGAVRIDLSRHLVTVRGEPVNLTRSEFQVLRLLAESPGQVFSRLEIMEELWQSEFSGDVRACDVHISNLRQKIERDPQEPELVVTVRGVGYRLKRARSRRRLGPQVAVAVRGSGARRRACAGAWSRGDRPVTLRAERRRGAAGRRLQTVESMRVLPKVESLLVDKGVEFTNSFASNPTCCPSRATYLTGQYSHNNGVYRNEGPSGACGPRRSGRARLAASPKWPIRRRRSASARRRAAMDEEEPVRPVGDACGHEAGDGSQPVTPALRMRCSSSERPRSGRALHS